jgi:hypothetical protein
MNTTKFVNEQNEEKQYKELYQKLADGEDLEKMKNFKDFDPDAVQKAKRSYYQDKMMEWKVQRVEDMKALAKADSLLQDGKLEESAKVLAEQYENFPNGEKAEVEKVVPKGTGKRDATRKLVFKNPNNDEVPDSAFDLTKENLQSVIDSGFAMTDPQTYMQTRMALNEERRQWNAEQAASPTEAVVLDPKTGKQKNTIQTYRVKDSKGRIRTKYVVDGKETWNAPEGKVVPLDTYYKKERLGLYKEGQELAEDKFSESKRHNQEVEKQGRLGLKIKAADKAGDLNDKQKKSIDMAADKIEYDLGVKPSFDQTKAYLRFVDKNPKKWKELVRRYTDPQANPKAREKVRKMLEEDNLGFMADWLDQTYTSNEKSFDEFTWYNPGDWFGWHDE